MHILEKTLISVWTVTRVTRSIWYGSQALFYCRINNGKTKYYSNEEKKKEKNLSFSTNIKNTSITSYITANASSFISLSHYLDTLQWQLNFCQWYMELFIFLCFCLGGNEVAIKSNKMIKFTPGHICLNKQLPLLNNLAC